jgi:hypothetical protein
MNWFETTTNNGAQHEPKVVLGTVIARPVKGGPSYEELVAENARLQARVAELEAPLPELLAAYIQEFGAESLVEYDDQLDRAMAAVRAALVHRSEPQAATDHFEEAKRTVASWPQWKQNIGHGLGPMPQAREMLGEDKP